MDILQKHEIFEMEVLERLKNAKLLDHLVFGGGTMLRLCYDLNRYSADLDFWFTRETDSGAYLDSMQVFLRGDYEVTDAQIKYHTVLCEIRSHDYPKRLKIEIRRRVKQCDLQERIAFSPHSTKQVALKVHTLEQTMKNKIEAAVTRQEIRDYFDLEFLLRKGIRLSGDRVVLRKLERRVHTFKQKDYKVTLGSTLEPDIRKYYVENNFSLLLSHITHEQGELP